MVVKRLSEQIKNVKIVSDNATYIINFEDADIPIKVPENKAFIEYESIAFGYSPNNYSTFGFNLTAEFPSLKYIVASFECSLGTKKDEEIFHNFNFGFGAGIKYDLSLTSTSLQIKYKNSGAIEYPHESKSFLAFELGERIYPVRNIPYYIFISFCHNFPDDKLFQDIFYAGVGIKL